MAVAGNKSGMLFTGVSFASVAEIADKCDPARYARRSACLLHVGPMHRLISVGLNLKSTSVNFSGIRH